MFKHTRGAGGGRVPRDLSAAELYWSGTYKAAKNLARYDPGDDEEPKGRVSAPNTVPLSETVRHNREIEQRRSTDVGKVLLRKGTGTSNRPAAGEDRPEASNTLQVANLSWTVNGHDLIDVFSKAGKVLSSHIICDHKTNRSRGFGFVEMDSEAAADAAIAKLNGWKLKGRAIRVTHAFSRKGHRASGSRSRPSNRWCANLERQDSGIFDNGRLFWHGAKQQGNPRTSRQIPRPPRDVPFQPRGRGVPKQARIPSTAVPRDSNVAGVTHSKVHQKAKVQQKARAQTSVPPRRKQSLAPEWKDTFRWQSDV